MYVTRPLSYYRKYPDALATPPEGPNSGYLIIQDEESETYCCFGLCKNRSLKDLPFPQNKELTVRYTTGGEHSTTYLDDVLLIPILNQPLSSNRYYAIKPHRNHKGEAFTCSREEDKVTCCFCRCVKDIKPRPLDPHNVHQQFVLENYDMLCSSKGQFRGKAVAPDAFPPAFFRRKGWTLEARNPKNYQLDLGEAAGVNMSIRKILPDFSSKSMVVGKWYVPFMFVKEGALSDQLKRSAFYEMTLERKWEQILACPNNRRNSVDVDVVLELEAVNVAGNKARVDARNVVDEVVWFGNTSGGGGGESRVGLRVEIVERMKWEEERAGWRGSEEKQVRVQREEECEDVNGWSQFSCYVLVESFVLKRMDGSHVLSYDFKHIHHIKTKWE